jgi:hypothetical protein
MFRKGTERLQCKTPFRDIFIFYLTESSEKSLLGDVVLEYLYVCTKVLVCDYRNSKCTCSLPSCVYEQYTCTYLCMSPTST